MIPFDASASRIVSDMLSPTQSRFDDPDRLKNGKIRKLSQYAGVLMAIDSMAVASKVLISSSLAWQPPQPWRFRTSSFDGRTNEASRHSLPCGTMYAGALRIGASLLASAGRHLQRKFCLPYTSAPRGSRS